MQPVETEKPLIFESGAFFAEECHNTCPGNAVHINEFFCVPHKLSFYTFSNAIK